MSQIAANLHYLFTELPFLARHAASMLAGHGIAGVIEPINKKMGTVRNGPSYTATS